MANICIIMGESGTGKSTSIKGLDPKETVVLNLLSKRLPFKGSLAMYNAENKNIFNVDSSDKIVNLVGIIDQKLAHIKNLIIDDCSYLMRKEQFARAKERGFDKFVDIALHMQQVIAACERSRDDLNVFIMFHVEPVMDRTTMVGYKIATVGKMVDQSYNPVEVVPVVLFADTTFDEHGKATYQFITRRKTSDNVVIPAKSPDGMFDSETIPNDLSLVVKAMNDYYNG